MKNYSLRFIAFGLFCTLVVSTCVYSSVGSKVTISWQTAAQPTEETSNPKTGPITNTTWGSAVKKSGKEGMSQTLFWLKYFKIPSLAFNYAIPTWGISKVWNVLGNTEQTAHGLAITSVLTAISLRYKKQIVECCDDEETADAWMGVAPLVGFLLPTKVSCCAALALVAALQSKEWLSRKKTNSHKPIIQWS